MIDPSTEAPPQRPSPPPAPGRRNDLLLLALAALLVGGGAWYWLTRPAAPAPSAAPLAPPVAEAAPAPAPAAPLAPVPAERQQALLDAVSPHAGLRGWLAREGVVERWALVTDNLAEGASPRKALAFLAPERPFTVAERGGATVMSAEGYRRYDTFAAAVASVDAAAAAAAYRALHGPLEAAYRALGYPEGSLDAVTARALRRLAAARPIDGEVALVAAPEGAAWSYADPRLEALGAVEKHLLRMGPRNGRLISAKAAELERALGLPPPPP